MKLLIAEDDLTSRIILERISRKWGYEPIAVANGKEAWNVMQDENAPKLLLLDWEMPELSGVELCKKIREKESDEPAFIILLTSRSTTQDIVTGLESGSNEYIAKPFENAELKARLEVGRRVLDLQEKRLKAERDKARLRRELQQTRKMEALGQITGGIAHDFNNILGIILGYTNMALDRYEDQVPEEMCKYLHTVIKSSERAKELVAKLLVFTEGEDKELKPLNLVEQVDGNLSRIKANMPDSISVLFDYEEEVPVILMDPAKLTQVLNILCDNAKDAMDGKGEIRIAVRNKTAYQFECTDCRKLVDGDWIELRVSDTGSGMDKDILEHIYEPFYTSKEFGQGMGMAMFHGISSRHGRHSLIKTEVGKGSSVSIFFPVD